MTAGYIVLRIFLIRRRGHLPADLRGKEEVDVEARVQALLQELEEVLRNSAPHLPVSSRRFIRSCGIPATVWK